MTGSDAVSYPAPCDRDGCNADILWRGVKEAANGTNYSATSCGCDPAAFAGDRPRARDRQTEGEAA